MTLKIEVTNSTPDIREGKSRDGNDYRIVTQNVYVHKSGEPYPDRMVISLEDESNSYKEGFYDLDIEKMIVRGQFDSMDLSRYPVLIPAKQPSRPQQG